MYRDQWPLRQIYPRHQQNARLIKGNLAFIDSYFRFCKILLLSKFTIDMFNFALPVSMVIHLLILAKYICIEKIEKNFFYFKPQLKKIKKIFFTLRGLFWQCEIWFIKFSEIVVINVFFHGLKHCGWPEKYCQIKCYETPKMYIR